jgi:hypothetical protein
MYRITKTLRTQLLRISSSHSTMRRSSSQQYDLSFAKPSSAGWWNARGPSSRKVCNTVSITQDGRLSIKRGVNRVQDDITWVSWRYQSKTARCKHISLPCEVCGVCAIRFRKVLPISKSKPEVQLTPLTNRLHENFQPI